jgi:hypothetical protein
MRLLELNQLNNIALAGRDTTALSFVRDCVGASDIKAIGNVETQMRVLDTGTLLFPVSVNDGNEREDNSYVVSPLTAYRNYAHAELKRLNPPWLTWPLVQLVKIIGHQLKAARIHQLVQVNNWLLSTNLYPPEWHGDDLPVMTGLLADMYPDYAIAFRSLNNFSNRTLLDRLHSLGYVSIPSRQVYLFDTRYGKDSACFQHKNNRVDAKLLDGTVYKIVCGDELSDSDFPRLEELYNQLYLDKYSLLNPQFSATWLRCGQRDGWLELRALRRGNGVIDAALGWFTNKQIMSTPFFGYDTKIPQQQGLYRMLSILTLQVGAERKCIINDSSGAAHFKRLRGGQPEIEYSMVYVRHLPLYKRLTWQLLGRVLHIIGVPIMKIMKL